jgi:hypothetical protein
MTIKSTDYKQVIADSFEVLVDPSPANAAPAIGFMVYPVKGKPFIIPIEFGTAKELAVMITKTLLFNAPHLFQDI